MAAFFERLFAEEDPTRFAAMAESLPEPPPFDATSVGSRAGLSGERAMADERRGESVAARPRGRAPSPRPSADGVCRDRRPSATAEADGRGESIDGAEVERRSRPRPPRRVEAAAEPVEAVEAAAEQPIATPMARRRRRSAPRRPRPDARFRRRRGRGRLLGRRATTPSAEEIPTIADDALAARLAGLVPDRDSSCEPDRTTTQVVVVGLVSVASIAGFKRHLGRVAGRPVGRRLVRPRRRVRLLRPPRRRRSPFATRSPPCPGFEARVTSEDRRRHRGHRARPRSRGLTSAEQRLASIVEESAVARPAVVVALPRGESAPVAAELRAAGFEADHRRQARRARGAARRRRDVAVAILDGETDFDQSLEYYSSCTTAAARSRPSWSSRRGRSTASSTGSTRPSVEDEYFTRPYSAESLRWRVEAMCIRSQTVDDGSGPVLQSGPIEADGWARRATVIAVFNPKGGVGKTTSPRTSPPRSRSARASSVLLVDADTVTGHVATSLGIEAVRTVADSWRDQAEGGPAETLTDIAAAHPSGMRVVSLTVSPLQHRDPRAGPRRRRDHAPRAAASTSSSSTCTRPTATSTGRSSRAPTGSSCRSRRTCPPSAPPSSCATSPPSSASASAWRWSSTGPTAACPSRTWSGPSGMPALALIRSGGLLFVRAANEGRTVIEMFPKERITEDFDALADRAARDRTAVGAPAKPGAAALGARRRKPSAPSALPPTPACVGARRGVASLRGSDDSGSCPLADTRSRGARPRDGLRRRCAGRSVDLLDAAQVEAVDEDRVDLARLDRPAAEVRASRPRPARTSRVARSSSRSGSEPGIEVDRPDDPERRHLEGDVVGDLVDLVGGSLGVGQRRQRGLAGEHDDQVVRVDALAAPAPARAAPSRRSGAHRTSLIAIGSRLLSASDEPAVDVPCCRRDAIPRSGRRSVTASRRDRATTGAVGRGGGDGLVLLALQEVERHVTPPPIRCWSGWSRRRSCRPGSSCRRGSGPRRCRAAAAA